MEGTLDISKKVKVGRWWFQRRSITPLPLFLLMILLPPQIQLTEGQLTTVVLGIVLAECLRIWAVGFAGSATRTRGDSVPALVHAGPFRFVRNPLYVANIAMYSLAGVLFGNVWLAVATLAFSSIQYTFIVAFEEETLRKTFGKPYVEYCQKVNRWIPSVVPSIASSGHEFGFWKSIKSEKSTFLSMGLVAVLYAVRAHFLKV